MSMLITFCLGLRSLETKRESTSPQGHSPTKEIGDSTGEEL
jgi:hypothetical protein